MANFFKKTGIFLQVRINSNRLPGKAVIDICGKPLIMRVMERLNVVPADERAILTTKDSLSVLEPFAHKMGWSIFTGNKENVLQRFVDAALYYNVNTVIRATGDNPLISSEIAIETLELFNKENCDLAYLSPIPYGSGVEVINTKALINALRITRIPYHLEHVTPFIYERKDMFKVKCGKLHDVELARDDVRLTVDTRDDYEKINYLFRNLGKKTTNLKIKTIIEIWDELKFKEFKRILFITAFSDSYGMGHFKRLLFFAEKFKNDFFIYFSFKHGNEDILSVIKDIEANYVDYNKLSQFIKNEGLFDRIIVDLRDTTIEEMNYYMSLGPVISIDDMGEGGKKSNINIRTLPFIQELEKNVFNFDGIEYLFTDTSKKKAISKLNNPPKNILITFGGSDPENLTQSIAEAFDQMDYNVTVIIGTFFNEKIEKIGNCKIIKNVSNLDKYLKNTDLVVTSFGMTFLESIIINKPVLLVNPSSYHERLTEDFEYPYYLKRNLELKSIIEIKSKLEEIINRMINEDAFLVKSKTSKLSKYFSLNIGKDLDALTRIIKEWTPIAPVCPYCCTINEAAIYRSIKWNMYKCKKCNLIYIIPFKEKEQEYDEKYFLDEYKKHYGKTYEEDKKNIITFAKERLKIIKKSVKEGDLLDFGSGLGFFAEYCENNGFKTTSIDISKYAVDYMRKVLNLNSINIAQEYLEKTDKLYNVITSFYVIEHIKDFERLIFLFSIHLKKNGLIALSTPNSMGISIKKNFNSYIKNHPDDHYRIFSPNFMKKILKKYGFTNIKIVITGIHIERLIKSEKIINNKIFKKIIYWYIKLFRLGDTFEIYAEKK